MSTPLGSRNTSLTAVRALATDSASPPARSEVLTGSR
jgi:hypothetical protein